MPRSPLTETIKRAEGMAHYVQENLSAEEYMLFLDMVDPLPEPAQKPSKKKAGKKSAGGGGRSAGKSARGESLAKQIGNRAQSPIRLPEGVTASDDYTDSSDSRCRFTRADSNPCKLLPDHNIHHLVTANEYHEFQPAQSAAASGD